MFRDYEQPILPKDWTGDWRTFAAMVVAALDELHEGITSGWLDPKLKAQIEGGGTDTGWVGLASYAKSANITPTSSRFHIRRIGKVVQLRIRFTLVNNLASNTFLDVTNAIPEQFRPPSVCRFLCTSSETGGMWLDVQEDGVIRTYSRGQAVAAIGYLSGDVVYMV